MTNVRQPWRKPAGLMDSAVLAAEVMSMAGTIMQATKLPLTTWFQAFYLIGQAKTGISSLELSRHLGVKYDTAWLLHNKILRAMTEREDTYVLRGKIQMDDAYLGGERPGGRWASNSAQLLNSRPAMAFHLTYATPRSSLPFVLAR